MVTDFMGVEVSVGDTVVYPMRRGSKMCMKEVRVVAIRDDEIVGYNPDGRRTTLKQLANIVKVTPRRRNAIPKDQ